jgi:c(7)-type cytochrome triheme protein
MLDQRRRWLAAIVVGLAVVGVVGLWWRPAVSMPDSVRIPIVKEHPKGTPPEAALFQHGRHDQFGCAACHPAVFPEWRAGFTHQDMRDGRFCGLCHDGTAAFDVDAVDCRSCHVPRSGK